MVLAQGEKLPKHVLDADLEIIEKIVKLEDHTEITEQKVADYMQKAGKKETSIVAGFSLMLILAAFFGPKSQPIQVMMPPQPVVTKITLKKDIEKQQREKKAAQAQQELQKPKQAQQGNPTKTAVTNSFVGGRLTQLLGKVSSQAAKSANVFVANGKKADEGSSARALAAVGNINRAGTDWGAQGKSGPAGVSTAGQAGGKGNSGLSGLSQGKIGAAGVGLIEEESEISGGLDPEVIAQYIKSQLGQILYCYERQLSANPELFGKVAVKFTIGPNGQVEARNINNSTLKNTNVEGCILSKIAGWKFPAPQGGTRVLVTYPFLFKSTN
jgi:outer membrane biosynthesis protein TonB